MHKVGALLIFDEVITGFRVSRGGASALFGVVPDLWCFGKVVGGGLPLAAFGGRRAVMDELAPRRARLPGRDACRVTRWRQQPASRAFPCSMTASTRNWRRSPAVSATGLAAAGTEAGLELQVPVVGPLIGMFFGRSVVRDYEGARASAGTGLYPPVMHGLLGRGVAIAPGRTRCCSRASPTATPSSSAPLRRSPRLPEGLAS